MLNITSSNRIWTITTDNTKILTAIENGLEIRIANVKYLLERGRVKNAEDAILEITELEELLKELN